MVALAISSSVSWPFNDGIMINRHTLWCVTGLVSTRNQSCLRTQLLSGLPHMVTTMLTGFERGALFRLPDTMRARPTALRHQCHEVSSLCLVRHGRHSRLERDNVFIMNIEQTCELCIFLLARSTTVLIFDRQSLS